MKISIFFFIIALSFLSSCNPLQENSSSVIGENFSPGNRPAGNPASTTLNSIPSVLAGGKNIKILFVLPPKSVSGTLEYSEDGGENYSLSFPLSPDDQFVSWTVPKIDNSTSMLRITSLDKDGKSKSVNSRVFAIDSTPPEAPTIINPPLVHNSSALLLTIQSCTDTVDIFISESSNVPDVKENGWQSCSTEFQSLRYHFISGDGAKALYVHAKDEAGNISEASLVSIILDQTAPALNWISAPIASSVLMGGGDHILRWSATDVGVGISFLKLEYSSDGKVFTLLADFPEQTTSFNWSVPTSNLSTAMLKLTSEDGVGNRSSITTPAFIIDSVPPVLTLNYPTEKLKGGSSVDLTFTGSDSLSGLNTLKLQFSQDGNSFSDLAILENSAKSYKWNVPSIDSISAKIRLVGIDVAGNTSTLTSTLLSIDSTPPNAPTVSLASTTPTNSLNASFTVSSCTDRAKIYVSTNSSTPSANALGWGDCTTGIGDILTTLAAGDGIKTYYFFAQDSVGNVSGPSTSIAITLDQTRPLAPEIVFPETNTTTALSNGLNPKFTNASCFDRHKILVTKSNLAPTVSDANWQNCSVSPHGISFFETFGADGNYSLRAWAMDESGNISLNPSVLNYHLDTVAPAVTFVEINNGDPYVTTPFATIKVSATDSVGPVKIRLAEADGVLDCQSQYGDDSWVAYSGGSQSYSFQLTTGDGVKKVCAWGKDAAGNVSEISPSGGTHKVDSDTIEYFVGNPPVITTFEISNNQPGSRFGTSDYVKGDSVKISWEVRDEEGLANKAVSLFYTVDNTNWLEIPGSYGVIPGNPKIYSGSFTDWTAPGTSYFRVKVLAHDFSGNTSIPSLSDTQNTTPWKVFAGTRDRGLGASGKTALLLNSTGGDAPKVAVDPNTNDIYAVDDNTGVVTLNAKTGMVSMFLNHGTLNLGQSGVLNSNSRLSISSSTILGFDKNGMLYVTNNASNTTSALMYQINPNTREYRLYLGGGIANDTGATPLEAFLITGRAGFTFDESNSIYFWSSCTPGAWTTSSTDMIRLLKMTQNKDGTGGEITRVFGSCNLGGIPQTGPLDPLTVNQPGAAYPQGRVVAYNNGDTLLISPTTGARYKIINGSLYRSNIPGSGAATYNPYDGKIYYGNSGRVSQVTLNLQGDNGDLETIFSGGGADPGCNQDGTPSASFCYSTNAAPIVTSQGKVLIVDGNPGGQSKPYRVLYIDSNSKVQTYLGSLPFYGEGLDKSLIRGEIASVHWKKSTDLNQTAFPEGLYFSESNGLLIGRIDPVTSMVSIIGGSQWLAGPKIKDGDVINKSANFGSGQGDLLGLVFDDQGLPWFKNENGVMSIDENLKAKVYQNKVINNYWQTAPDGADPRNYGAFPYIGYRNMAVKKDEGVFVIGGGAPSGTLVSNFTAATYFDFKNNVVNKIMGDYPGQTENKTSTSIPAGNLKNNALSGNCSKGGSSSSGCFIYYDNDEDRLYFADMTNSIKYISNPLNPALSSLSTLFSTGTAAISNFFFSEDKSMIFYLKSGYLYCHDLSSGKAWCNDTSLGPPSGMNPITSISNQFTWKDSSTLLISNGKGEIYSYTLSP